MNDANAMCLFQHIANLSCYLDRSGGGKSPFPSECLRQGFAFYKLHDDEVPPIWQITSIEDRRRVRMSELRHRSCFAQKTIRDVAIRGKFRFDDLDSNRSFESEMRSEIDSSHPASADFAFDFEPATDELRHIHNDLP